MELKTNPDSLPLSWYKKQFEYFGYGLNMWVVCIINGKKYRYHTYPLQAGSHGYFDTKKQLFKYLKQIQFVRSI